MKRFADLETIKYIIAHTLYGEYNFKQKEIYLILENGSQLGIASVAGGSLVQILIPVELVEEYLASDVNKDFPASDYDKDAAGNINTYLKGIDLDDTKFIEMFDKWVNSPVLLRCCA